MRYCFTVDVVEGLGDIEITRLNERERKKERKREIEKERKKEREKKRIWEREREGERERFILVVVGGLSDRDK